MRYLKMTIPLFFGLVWCFDTSAQLQIGTGLSRSHFTISPSYQFQSKQGHFAFHGGNDLYVSRRVSIATDGYFYLGSLNKGPSEFDYNHSVLWGGNFHIVRGMNDLYFGLQPGVSFTKIDAERNDIAESNMGINPIGAATVGYNCYISKFFHFFVQSKLVLGNHGYNKAQSISETKVSAGLGFNIR